MGKQRLLIIVGAILCGILGMMPAQADFGPEVRISSIRGPSIFPRLAVANGVVHVVWVEYLNSAADPEIYYSRSSDNGASWIAPINLSNTPNRPDTLPLIASSGSDIYVTWTTDPVNGEIYFRHSADGGGSWQSERQLSASTSGYSRATDLWIDRTNNLHLVYYDNRHSNYGHIFHRMSCDRGQSWTPEKSLTESDGVVDNEYPRIGQLPSGRLYVVFRSTRAGRPQGGWPPFSLFGVRSISAGCPGGASWFYPAQALSSTYPEEFANTYSPTVLTLSDSRLGLIYWDRKQGNNIVFRRGAPEGQGWESPVGVANFPFSQPEADGNVEAMAPSLAELPGSRLYAAFQQTTATVEGFAVGPVLYASSADGKTWTTATRVPTQNQTMHPRMIQDSSRLHFVWADFRHSAEGSLGAEIYYRNFASTSVPPIVPPVTPIITPAMTNLVKHYYQAIFKRPADAGGLDYWHTEILRLQGLGIDIQEAFRVMAGWFFTSTEYLGKNPSDTQYVTDLYLTFFNRAPDSSGLGYWSGQLGAGLPRSVLLFAFLFSPEFGSYMQGLIGNTASRGEINAVVDFYRGFLNRLPDSSGFNYWLGRFRTAQCQGAAAINTEVNDISRQYLVSAEYIGRQRDNSGYVADLYYAFLRRGGDLGGFNYWVTQLNSGSRSREQVRQDFAQSPEFQSRVQQIISAGCIK